MAILNDSVKLEDFKKYFFGSFDNVGKQYKTKDGEVKWVSGKIIEIFNQNTTIDNLLEKHLNKQITIGSYPYYRINGDPMWYCQYIMIDIDDHDSKDKLSVVKKLNNLSKIVKAKLIDHYSIEEDCILRDFSGRGYHIWIKLKKLTPLSRAWDFRVDLEAFLKEEFNLEIELFPKQSTMVSNNYGNCCKLPLSINRNNDEFSNILDGFDLAKQGNGYEIIHWIAKCEKVKKVRKEDKQVDLTVNQSEQIEREIAHGVMARIHIATPKETDQMHIYRNGIYTHERFDSTIKQIIKEIANNTLVPSGKEEFKAYYLSIAKQNMIIDFIKSFGLCNLEDFDSNERIINTKTGLYYLDGYGCILPNPRTEDGHYESFKDTLVKGTKFFQTHEEYITKYSKPYKSFIQIPVIYDPKAENLEIDQIFSDIFGFKTILLIYEMIGYLLLPNTMYGKAFMLYGETGTGKTSALNVITQFIGHENIAGIELQKLDDKFELEKTRNKLINIFDDLSSKPIKYVGNFKKLVTNTWLYGRIKFIQEEIRWKNRCKGLFACNVLPKIKEYVTDAFHTRWVLVPCFNDMKEKGIKDSKIREKKYSESELSGLFNKVIQALKRLEERGNFPEEWQDIDYVKNYWNMDINPVAKFIEDCCDKGELYEVDYEQFFSHLNKFRKEKRVKEITKTLMTRSLTKIGIEKGDRGSKVPKERRYFFLGIDFNTDYILAHEELQNYEEKTMNNYING